MSQSTLLTSTPTTSLLGYLSLLLLVGQNCSVIILTRIVKQNSDAPPFSSAFAVLLAETIKIVICSIAAFVTSYHTLTDPKFDLVSFLYHHLGSTIKTSVPALCYTLQSNLIFFSLSHLEVVVFQILYQSKLLLGAILSVLIIGKRLDNHQWIALLCLFTGVVMTQLGSSPSKHSHHGSDDTPEKFSTIYVSALAAAVAGATSSAFAGVYFELLLKNTTSSLWAKNIHLGLCAIPISIFILTGDSDRMYDKGLFAGFSPMVFGVVILQASGGLLVAMCMKYADNILKNFATSVAILLGGFVSVVFFQFEITRLFFMGAVLVFWAIVMYDKNLWKYLTS